MNDDKLSQMSTTLLELVSDMLAVHRRLDEMDKQRLRDLEVQETRDRALQASLTELREVLERHGERP